jgi:hypothetical protein
MANTDTAEQQDCHKEGTLENLHHLNNAVEPKSILMRV